MGEAKHTPGPWRAVAQGGSSTVVTPTLPVRNERRAEVAYGYKESNGYCVGYPFLYQARPFVPDEETRMDFVCFSHADAHLIAAAPELLAALKGLLADIEDYQRINNLGGENNHWQVLSRAAIAKAEGRS